MRTLLTVLAVLLALLHPWLALGGALAAIAGLGWLISRAARGLPFPPLLPWRTT